MNGIPFDAVALRAFILNSTLDNAAAPDPVSDYKK